MAESTTATTEEEPLFDDDDHLDTVAISHDKLTLLRGGLATWQAKMAQRRAQQQQAAEVDRKKLLQDGLTAWRYKLRSHIVETKLNARIAREALQKMVLAERCASFQKQQKQKALQKIMLALAEKKQMKLEAAAIVLAEQKAAAKELAEKERQKQEAAAFALAEKTRRKQEAVVFQQTQQHEAASFQQDHKQKRLQGAMKAWAEKARKVKEHRQQQEAVAQALIDGKDKATGLRLWCGQMIHQQEMENTALIYYQPRLVYDTFIKWRERTHQKGVYHEMEKTALEFSQPRVLKEKLTKWRERTQEHQEHIQQLETWSEDADFYFRASRTFKIWRAATEASKREKRKIAYTQVRRTIKINLARSVIQIWREKAQQILALKKQAQAIDAEKLVATGITFFQKWRTKAADVENMEEVARKHALKKHLAAWKYRKAKDAEVAEMEEVARKHVLKKHLVLWQERRAKDAQVAEMEEVARKHTMKKFFGLWKQRLEDHQALELEAALTYQENRQSQILKKWNLNALHIQSQTNWAADVREKNAKRNFRKMFTYWRQRATEDRPLEPPESVPDDFDDRLGSTTRTQAWYSATPSKRRTTHSTTPRVLSTPLEKQLRAQYDQ